MIANKLFKKRGYYIAGKIDFLQNAVTIIQFTHIILYKIHVIYTRIKKSESKFESATFGCISLSHLI